MEMESYEHGVPSWLDVSAPDSDEAATFYHGLFGWDVEPATEEFGGYRNAQLRGRRVAGIAPKMSPDMPTVWSSYVNVDDAQAVADKVVANGGQVMFPPMAVGALGTMGIFIDPEGAVFGVWQAGEHKGAGLVNEPGTFGWSELMCDDPDKAIPFYEAVFGWGHDTQGEDSGMPYTEWKVDGRSVGGMMKKPPTMPPGVPSYWGVYFLVDDCDAAAAKVTELGGSVMQPPMDIQPGRFALVADPAGAMFCIMKLTES